MALRIIVLAFLAYVKSEGGLCSMLDKVSTEITLRAKRVALNYLALDDRAFRLNQNVTNLDQEFLCALDILSKRPIDLELQAKLANFSPKPWNKASWLDNAYEKILRLIEPNLFSRLKSSVLKSLGANRNRFEVLCDRGLQSDFTPEEIKLFASILSEFPLFVTMDFIKGYAQKSPKSFSNALTILSELGSIKYFSTQDRYYQSYRLITGMCEKMKPSLEYLLSCQNFDYKTKVSISIDLLKLVFADNLHPLSSLVIKNLQTGHQNIDRLLSGSISPNQLFNLMAEVILPASLLSRANIDFQQLSTILVNRFTQLKTEQKVRILFNLSRINLQTPPVDKILIRETNDEVCMVGANLFSGLLLPIQGKMQRTCSDVLIWSRFCEPTSWASKKTVSAAALLANDPCLYTISGLTLTNKDILLELFYTREFLKKIVIGKFKLTTFPTPFFMPHELPEDISDLSILDFLDDDHKEFVYLRLGLDLSKLSSTKLYRNFLNPQSSLSDLILPLLGRTFTQRTLIEQFKKRIETASSPEATLEIVKQFTTIFCNSDDKESIAKQIAQFEDEVQNFRTLIQLRTLRFTLTREEKLLNLAVLTPYRLDLEEILKAAC